MLSYLKDEGFLLIVSLNNILLSFCRFESLILASRRSLVDTRLLLARGGAECLPAGRQAPMVASIGALLR